MYIKLSNLIFLMMTFCLEIKKWYFIQNESNWTCYKLDYEIIKKYKIQIENYNVDINYFVQENHKLYNRSLFSINLH